MEHKFNVGDTVYIKEVIGVKPFKVCKVGRKNFYIEGSRYYDGKGISIETLRYIDPKYTQGSFNVYLSLQAIEDETTINNLTASIRKYIGSWGEIDLPLDALRQIDNIIQANQTT